MLDRERRYPAWPSPRRNFTGLYYAAMMNAHVPFESWLERDVAMAPDLDPPVLAFASHSFWLSWTELGVPRPGAGQRRS